MSGETERNVSGWTLDTYAVHNEALRQARKDFDEERDRRYREVAHEREKSELRISASEEKAMSLARDIQTYKDVKANELREQLGKERLDYASKLDLKASVEKIEETLKPLNAFVAAQQSRTGTLHSGWGYVMLIVVAIVALATYLKA